MPDPRCPRDSPAEVAVGAVAGGAVVPGRPALGAGGGRTSGGATGGGRADPAAWPFSSVSAPVSAPASPSVPSLAPPAWDLPARALATALIVLVLTNATASLGPTLTGILAPFPVASSVVAAFTRAQLGPPATVSLLGGLVRGLPGFAILCFWWRASSFPPARHLPSP